KRGTPSTVAQLADHDALIFAPSGRTVPWTLHGPNGAVEDAAPKTRLVSNGMLALRDAARAGGGLAIMPEFLIADDLAAGRMAIGLPGWTPLQAELFAVYPSTRNLSPKVRAFLEFVVARMSPPPWSRGD